MRNVLSSFHSIFHSNSVTIQIPVRCGHFIQAELPTLNGVSKIKVSFGVGYRDPTDAWTLF